MSLINCKIELNLKWERYHILAATLGDNTNANPNSIFTIKDTKLYVPAVPLPARDNQKLSKPLSKGCERFVYYNEYKTSERKNSTNNYRHFLELNFVGVNRHFVLVYLGKDVDAKRS